VADKHAGVVARLKKSIAKVDAAQSDRDRLIVEAVKESVPVPQIAAAVGLSRARVYQIMSDQPK
jgi:DNA-directed RNA polymerase specialized sigma subunit